LAENAKAWPFQEARRVLKRIGGKTPEKGYVLFQTGYGPSGLPHIGTFGEVQRTTMVRQAFQRISDIPTRLFAFSDDMDGMRKIPDNIPNKELLEPHMHKPLTRVPDPFGTHEGFAQHNNARLCAFLDDFGFDYEFVSATECYTSGRFDDALRRMLEVYDDVMQIMLPTLGEERRKTYSPFLPVCPETGHVLQVPVVETNPDAETIVYEREDGKKIETPVTGGACKLQWKPDWAMRWYALGVDYEMSGKDLIDSVQQSRKICRALGSRPPESYTY
jgi:lysyl-tRNA synthetase class 1